MKLSSAKTQMIVFLAVLAVFWAAREGDGRFLAELLVAAVTAVCVDGLIGYVKSKKFSITESSLITGLIAGFVLDADKYFL